MDRVEQSEIEARLKEALGAAKAAYESAKKERLQELELREDLGAAHPDGALAFRQASRNRDWALGKYNQAPLRFNGFYPRRQIAR